MYGFRTHIALAAFGMALLAGPAWASGVGGDVTETTSTPDINGGTGVTVTRNIDNDTTIDSDSVISVNKTFNGVNVGYGMGGTAVLNSVTNATSNAANYNAGQHATALQLESMVLSAVGQ